MRQPPIFDYGTEPPRPWVTPKRSLSWPDAQDDQNQLQQIKGAVDSPHANVNQVVLNPSSPQVVSGLTIHRLQGETTHQLTVQFKRNTQDQYFQGVNVFLQSGSNPPVQVGSGTKSPIKVSVAHTNEPSTVFVQSIGRWGNTPLDNSPAQAVNLSGPSNGTTSSSPLVVCWGGGGGGGGGGGPGSSNFADAEVPIPAGGSNYTLAHAPSPLGSLELFNNGQLMTQGAGSDYTLSGLTITLAVPAGALISWYRY